MKVFLCRQTCWGRPTYKTYSEDNNGKWKDLQSINDFSQADYLIYYNRPNFVIPFDPTKTFCFHGEPDEFYFTKYMWDGLSDKALNIYKRPINHWHSFITYKEFKEMKIPEKTRDLSWATTSQGDNRTPANIQITEGQKLRMHFLQRFLTNHPNKMYLFGRNLQPYFNMQDFKYCGGELWDLWDAVKDSRYSIAFETSYQEGYFCKLYDPILAGCMPIYWGCPDLEKYLPKNSFIRVDLRKDLDSVCDEIVEIIKSDFREQNLDALREARELLLTKWNIWEIFYQEIKKYEEKKD